MTLGFDGEGQFARPEHGRKLGGGYVKLTEPAGDVTAAEQLARLVTVAASVAPEAGFDGLTSVDDVEQFLRFITDRYCAALGAIDALVRVADGAEQILGIPAAEWVAAGTRFLTDLTWDKGE
jgi:hypothetical protein